MEPTQDEIFQGIAAQFLNMTQVIIAHQIKERKMVEYISSLELKIRELSEQIHQD